MLQVDTDSMESIELISEEMVEEMLLENLRHRQLPDFFLYADEAGARRWLELCSSDEFPIAARLTDLVASSAPAIAAHFEGPLHVVSIGVGGGEKERLLLEALLAGCGPRYLAVDVCDTLVRQGLKAVGDMDIPKAGAVARLEDLQALEEHWDSPALLCLLGNSFSNFEPDLVLGLVREFLAEDDAFLFDCSLLPAGSSNGRAALHFAEQVEKVYRSELNRRFNTAPLVDRGLDPAACVFQLDLIQVDTGVGKAYRTSKKLEMLQDAVVSVGTEQVAFLKGETIQMGYTYKYEPGQVRALLARHGFRELELACSPDGDNMLALVH